MLGTSLGRGKSAAVASLIEESSYNRKFQCPTATAVRLPVFRLSFDFGMLSQEFPVWIDLEARLFSVRSDDDLIIPFAICVVFPFYLNDLSSRRLLLNRLLNRGGKRL